MLPLKSPLRGCPTTPLMPALVILSEAKNLIFSGIYTFEILRLTPQNDVVGQPPQGDLYPGFTLINPDFDPILLRISQPRPPATKPHSLSKSFRSELKPNDTYDCLAK